MNRLEQKIFHAMDHRKIADMVKQQEEIQKLMGMQPGQMRDELKTLLANIVVRTSMAAGIQTPNQSFVAIIVSDLKDMLKDDFSMFTVEEVQLAFSLGVQGKFGHYYTVNMETLGNWLKSYKNCEERLAVMEARNRNPVKSDSKPYSRILKGRSEDEYAEEVFMAYRAGISLENYSPSLAYEFFERNGKIHDTREEKLAALKMVQRVPLTILTVPLEGVARESIMVTRAMRYLLERNFDRWIAEEKAREQALEEEREKALEKARNQAMDSMLGKVSEVV